MHVEEDAHQVSALHGSQGSALSQDCPGCSVFLLLLALGLTASSWLMLAFLPVGCEGAACQPAPIAAAAAAAAAAAVEQEPPPLTIFVSVASYRDWECKHTLQVLYAIWCCSC